MKKHKLSWIFLIALSFIVDFSRVFAYEDSLTVGLSLGTNIVDLGSSPSVSPISASLSSSIEMTESWSIRSFAEYSYFQTSYLKHSAKLGAEMIYLLDILEWVPFFGSGTSLLAQFNSKKTHNVNLGIHGVVGFDWLFTPEWILGLDMRGGLYPAGYQSSALGFFSTMLRISRKFELD